MFEEEQDEKHECNYCSRLIDIDKQWCSARCLHNDLNN